MWSFFSFPLKITLPKLSNNSLRNSSLIIFKNVTYKRNNSNVAVVSENNFTVINGVKYAKDGYTNVTPHILSFISRDLHHLKNHPLNLIKQRIIRFMYGNYVNWRGTPLFSVYDRIPPVVTTEQNFDCLLIPVNHPSRNKSDSYYLNSKYLLRPHTSAHQHELIKAGLDHFLVIGDVYRRDEIDSTHYPVFHQCEGVRLLSSHEIFNKIPAGEELKLFEKSQRDSVKQGCHTLEAVKLMEKDLKDCLVALIKRLFGKDIKHKWSESFFPFTHPSWELEISHNDEWLEILGCGIMEQDILNKAGATEKIGWAFGIGLERLAMKLYSIPDVRLFWTQDTGFLSQFEVKDIDAPITYKAISRYPQCTNDISFWVPEDYHPNDFYDIARGIGGEIIEQIYLVDEFFHPKHKKQSYCYRIVYRHMERTLTQKEVNEIHKAIETAAVQQLCVEIR